jgi:hypothetical protein
MPRSKQTSKARSRRRAVTAWGVAGALSLAAGGASASIGPAGDLPTENTAPVFTLGEEEISDVSLATFYVFDKENARAHRPGVQLAARACGRGCRGCARGCGGCARGCRGCAVGGCGGCGGGCCIWIAGVRIC